jgi:putative salt-induced outer membrane protein YdiY
MNTKKALCIAVPLSLSACLNGLSADPTTDWVSSAAAGLTLTRGNSETLMATLAGTTGKKWDQHELSFGASGTYGESEVNGVNTKNAESFNAFGQYNHLFTERLYGYGRAEFLHDGIAAIRYRVTLTTGAGYYFIKQEGTEFSAEGGPGYIWDDLGGVYRHYVTLRFAEKIKHDLSDRARVWQTAEFLPQIDDFSNFIINAEIGIEADITADKKLSLRSYIQDTYNNEPAPGREKNDAKLVAAIVYKF